MWAPTRWLGSPTTDDDFPGSESDELLAAARAVDVEGRMNGDARGREIAACAAVGGEMPTGFRRLGAIDRVLIA